MRRRNKAGPECADLRTNQLNQNILLTGVLPAARDVLSQLSTTTGWLRALRLRFSTVICNGIKTARKRPQLGFQSHKESNRHLTA